MTLFEVEELTRYWLDHPPLHLMIGAYLGFGAAKRPDGSGRSVSRAEADRLLAELGPGFKDGDVHAGLRAPVLNFLALRGGSGGET